MSKKRYLITLWIDWHAYDSLLKNFSIEYEATNLKDANLQLDKIAREMIKEGLKEFEDFGIMKITASRDPISVNVNKNNKVLRKERKKIGDGSRYNFVYYNFDIIEVPIESKVDENLFNLKDCDQEVKAFFKYRYGQYQKRAQPERRFIGVRELAKSKLGLTSFSWLSKIKE